MMFTLNLFSLLIGFVGGGAAVAIYLEYKRMKEEIAKIKQDQAKRLPHGTLATLEDIHGVINDVRFQNIEVDKVIQGLMISQTMRQYQDDGLQRIKELISDIQDNARNYKDHPNRKKNLI